MNINREKLLHDKVKKWECVHIFVDIMVSGYRQEVELFTLFVSPVIKAEQDSWQARQQKAAMVEISYMGFDNVSVVDGHNITAIGTL